ncbi:MAG TPA: zinc metallopeptidase [Candidatus Hydrogenedentes bacterium]|nr:zinc metallopeptidase [Candidatus Hydrogenedentota bacterium]HPC16203.1 zinc metallopeptidase [Candidatus Hydrogenedentota bacterium]HRT18585.1 zinc metallopeptidase [Candidatus Hydrogenedentota bacterium]HRT63604.1 zinc metallopeptidase [Candidatus Hydrogenedentota bacterium]
MYFPLFDPTMILLIPAMILAVWAQIKVKSTYAKFSQVATRSGLTGADVAKLILQDANIPLSNDPSRFPGGVACGLAAIPGELTDHYDPRTRMLNLSEDIYYGRSIAALGIAAHEVGHAIQHAQLYGPLALRNIIYPVCGLGSTLAFPLFFIGLIANFGVLMQVAILLFTLAVFFTVLTLPVEFNASRRALLALENGGYLTADELYGARKVLSAAAMTYIAAAAMAIMQLIRMLLIARSRD